MSVVVYTDGAARGNPGPAGAGAVILQDGVEWAALKKFLGHRTNNQAEYEALILALAFLKERQWTGAIRIHADSELMVRQLKGIYRVKNAELKELFDQAQSLLKNFPRCDFIHVPRAQNERADELANEAIDEREE